MRFEKIGTYSIEGELGKGGMGTVFLGVDPETRVRAAIKVLTPQLAQEPNFLNRFRREIATLQQLDHPNIVRLLGAGEVDGAPYYVMEYVEGDTLDDRLERLEKLPLREALIIVKEVSKALDYSHQKGVIHRDIKPGNILLGLDGAVKLTDFGIARVVEATRMTRTGAIIGTAEYMSPEQAEGKVLDRRSDIYSLGVVLYRMLTGRPPFSGTTAVELLKAHRYSIPESPKELNPTLPMSVVNLITEEMLAKDPSARLATAQALIRRIEQIEAQVGARGRSRRAEAIAEGLAPIIVGEGWSTRIRQWFMEHSSLALLLILVVAIALLGYYLIRPKSDPAEALFREAMQMKQEGRYADARTALWKIPKLFPKSPFAGRSEEELLKMRLEQLEKELGEMVMDHKRLSEEIAAGYALQRAIAKVKENEKEDAREMLRGIIKLFPKTDYADIAQRELDALGKE